MISSVWPSDVSIPRETAREIHREIHRGIHIQANLSARDFSVDCVLARALKRDHYPMKKY